VYGRNFEPLTEHDTWNDGEFANVVWDRESNLLVITCLSNLMPGHVRALATFDSYGCPAGRREPRLVFAVHPEGLGGSVFPTPTNGSSRPRPTVEWAFSMESGKEDNALPLSMVTLQTLNPTVSDRTNIGILYIVSQPIVGPGGVSNQSWASTTVTRQGTVLEPIRVEGDPNSQIAQRITPLDLNAAGQAESVAELLTTKSSSFDDARRTLDSRVDILPQIRIAAIDIVSAHFANWRYLHSRVEAMLDNTATYGPRPGNALAWAMQAVNIHNSRCPQPGKCDAGWYALHTLARVQCRCELWDEAEVTLARCLSVWEKSDLHNCGLDASDIALTSMLLAGRGDAAGAQRELQRAIQAAEQPEFKDARADAQSTINEARQFVGTR
jgi:hypothetical protein